MKSTSDGLVVVRNNADSANGSITTGTLTLTPATADTTALTVNGGSVTGSGTTSLIDLSGTWNTSGSPTFLKVNVTNTASGASALLADFQASGTSQVSISKGGAVTTVGQLDTASNVSAGAGAQFIFAGRTKLRSAIDGNLQLGNNGNTDFGLLQFGGASSSFPALKRSTTYLQVRLADDSAATSLQVELEYTGQAAPTIASAATIAPTKRITFVSGTTTIDTITAPSPISSTGGQITLIPTGVFATSTAGNIALATTAVVSKALIMTYDQATAKWYPSY